MSFHWLTIPKSVLIGSLVLALALVVACGSAAPEVVEREVIVEKEVIKEVPKEVVVTEQVIKEVPREVVVTEEVIKEVEVLKEIPKETVVESIVIATPTPIPVSAGPVTTKVTRVIYALGEVQETNRHWTVGRVSNTSSTPIPRRWWGWILELTSAFPAWPRVGNGARTDGNGLSICKKESRSTSASAISPLMTPLKPITASWAKIPSPGLLLSSEMSVLRKLSTI